MKKIEILAPAGSLEKLKFAIDYGADAVYIGGRDYSLRANATNFSLEEIKQALLYAHKNQAKIYVTINILFHNHDFFGLIEYLKELEKYKVDAIIVADVSIIKLMNENNIKIPIHLSTQTSNINKESVKFYKSLGVERIVLGREVSKKDLIDIKKEVDIELETFIHGAMCISYSGRCMMSNYLTNRDSNRGGCSQICRFDFNLLDKDKNIIKGNDSFSMCAKDLSMITKINELIELGITSLKIEGRMRSVYYIATIVNVYRKVIDRYYQDKNNFIITDEEIEELRRCANREATVQFFDKLPTSNEQYYNGREEVSNQDFLGLVLDYDYDKQEVIIGQRNYFEVLDEVVIYGPHTDHTNLVITKIVDEEMQEISKANHPKQIVRIPSKIAFNKNDIMRVKW